MCKKAGKRPVRRLGLKNGHDALSEQADQILQIGGVTAKKGKHTIHCLTIIGQIEGHYILPAQNKTTKYEHA